MRILLYSISYSPEVAGSGRFNGELTKWLAEQGHHVDVITAHPYYPEWKVRSEYRHKGWFTEKADNLSVFRTPLYVPEHVTGKTRILHELSFAINSLVHWLRVLFRRYDVLIGVCPPLLAGWVPYIFSRLKKTPFVFHIQDLQVDAARNLGLIKNKQLLSFLDSIERYLLRNAECVSSISEGMKRNILSKGTPAANYFMLENWTDIDTMRPIPAQESLRTELGFSGTDKIVLYSGNIGEKQGLEILIEVAAQLSQYSDITILVVGEGVARKKLVEQAEQKMLKNIRFLAPIPYSELPRMLSIADIHLVIQKRATSDLVMPSKFVNILSVGGGAIVSADTNTSLRDIIVDNQLGWVVEPEQADKLANEILLALRSPQLHQYRLNARKYAEDHLSKQAILPRFEAMLSKLVNSYS
ncbi:WcaI family glycosyltransferase [Spirosoma endbachense]|uniref:WcaI family glycosyltransferase n=1 Tax=Spirosoma endbachense TaxID=2666025 RepID=A0A6P1W570_9BACT|nr:WcaI family glycosyltransferase [Spirosoma endbachense]QHW00494.1 WcaI family glycosyltransferase [Spirosoma endbachense]